MKKIVLIFLFCLVSLFANEVQNRFQKLIEIEKNYESIKKDGNLKKTYLKEYGGYLLVVASRKDDTSFIKELLNNGVDINYYELTGKQYTRTYGVINPLLSAAKEKNLEVVKLLLENGADINTKDTYNLNALAYALYDSDKKDRALIKLLLDNGINTGLEIDDYRYALSEDEYSYFSFALTFSNDLEIVKMVGEKSNPNSVIGYHENNHVTSYMDRWHRKEFSFSCDRLKLALKYTKNIDNINLQDQSALSFIILKDYRDKSPFTNECTRAHALKLFINTDKNITIEQLKKIIDDEKQRIKDYVDKRDYATNLLKKRKYDELYKHIESLDDISGLAKTKRKSFLASVLGKYRYLHKNEQLQKIAKLLIKKGADVNQGLEVKFLGSSPFEDALRFESIHPEYEELITLMAKHGANPNTQYRVSQRDTHWTPLFYAIAKNKPEIFDILIKNGADVNYVDEKSLDLFYFAIYNKNIAFAKKLIDAGFKLNFTPSGSRHPLAIAAFNSDLESLKYLISLGYDPKQKVLSRKNLLEFMLVSPNKDLGRPEHYNQKIFTKTFEYVIEQLKDELNKPIELNYLFLALDLAKKQSIEVSQILIDNGIDITKHTLGYSPLQFGKLNDGYIFERVRFLIEQGVELNNQDKDGDTPLHQFVMHYSKLHKLQSETDNFRHKLAYDEAKTNVLKSINYLLEKGANKSIKNKKGQTPYALVLDKDLENIYQETMSCQDKKDECRIFNILK